MEKIKIIDEIMGRGKTTAMIRFMNEAPLEQRFLFITPYLEEVERIVSQCTSRNFKQPIVEGTKSKSLSWLIKHGCNVVLTHALFLLMDQETLDAAKTQGYTLIIDEELSAIEQIQVTPNDAGTMFEKYVLKDDTKRLTWTDENYKGIFEEYKERISKRQVYCYNEQYWLEILPPEYFTSFREVYVMTYRFQSQTLRCYFDLMQLSWSSLYVQGDSPENYHISDTPGDSSPGDFSHLIHIVENEKMNEIGDKMNALSKSWYERQRKSSPLLRKMQKNVQNFFTNIAQTPSGKNLWTVFSGTGKSGTEWKRILSGCGYARSFLSCNARGTNSYRDRTALAYLVNRFPDPELKNFFRSQGIEFDADEFALTELLQWIWRSAIRDGCEIQIYIPSRRMRNLLKRWLGLPEEDVRKTIMRLKSR